MSGYKSTTAIPENRKRKQKEIEFDNTDGTTKDIWIPPNGKKIHIDDVVFAVLNKHATAYIIVVVQVYVGGWRNLAVLGVPAQSSKHFVHNFGARVQSTVGDGLTARIRMAKSGGSTNWEAHGGITGEEV